MNEFGNHNPEVPQLFFFADLDENCMNLRVLLLRSYYITYKVPGFLFGIFFCISRYHRQCTCLMILSKLSTQSVEIFSMQTLLKKRLSKNLTLNIQFISWVRQIVSHFYYWKVDVKILSTEGQNSIFMINLQNVYTF